MLETVFKSGHCQKFVKVLQRLGYSDICKKITETDLKEIADEQPAGNMTFLREHEASGDTAMIRTLERALENVGIVKKLQEFMEQMNDKFETLTDKLEDKDAMYSHLQAAYAKAREKNNSLTIRLQEMNRETQEHKKEIEKLKCTVKELQQCQEASLGSDEVRNVTEEQQSRIKLLEEECRRKTEEVQRVKREMEMLETNLKKYSETISKLQNELEKKEEGKKGFAGEKKKRVCQSKDTGMGHGNNKPFFP